MQENVKYINNVYTTIYCFHVLYFHTTMKTSKPIILFFFSFLSIATLLFIEYKINIETINSEVYANNSETCIFARDYGLTNNNCWDTK